MLMGVSPQKVVVMKDQVNKKAHEESAQLACEAAGSIRTIASLTREDDCLQIYSKSLEEPLRRSNRSSIGSNLLYALSQSLFFLVIALVFWYGALLVSRREATIFEFFIVLMVCVSPPYDLCYEPYPFIRALFWVSSKLATSSLLFQTCPLPRVPDRRLSGCSIQGQKSMQNPRKALSFLRRVFEGTFASTASISAIRLGQGFACSAIFPLKLNLAHTWPLSVQAVQERVPCAFTFIALG